MLTIKERTKDLIKEIVTKGMISEREILIIKKRLNAGAITLDDCDLLINYDNPLKLTQEQRDKGFAWLTNFCFTKSGNVRNSDLLKRSDIGEVELEIVKNLADFEFVGFVKPINFYLPVYRAVDATADYFDYYVCGGLVKLA